MKLLIWFLRAIFKTNVLFKQPASNLAVKILIFVEVVSMKNIRHFLKTVTFWFVQKAFLKKCKNTIGTISGHKWWCNVHWDSSLYIRTFCQRYINTYLYLYLYLSIYFYIYIYIYALLYILLIFLSIYLLIYLSIYLSIYLYKYIYTLLYILHILHPSWQLRFQHFLCFSFHINSFRG